MIDHAHDLGKLEAQVEQLRVDVVKLSALVGAVGGWIISLMIPKL